MNTVISKLFVVALLFSACYSSRLSMFKKTLTNTRSSWNMNTRANAWGDGHVIFLDRHDVYCNSDEVMQGWHFHRPSPTTIAYEFKCKKVDNPGKITEHYTDLNEYRDYGTNYLDRHRLSCPTGSALNGFHQISREDIVKIQIFYKCIEVNVVECSSTSTKESVAHAYGDTRFPSIYLDRQPVQVADDEAITGYQLHTRYASKIAYYHYEVLLCKLIEEGEMMLKLTSTDGKVYEAIIKDGTEDINVPQGQYTLTASENVVIS